MRGAQDAYVEGDHLRPAHAYQFPFLKHAQQPPLKGKRQVSDFIEEQGSGVGQLEHARLALTPRAGKRTFLIAEKFAFQQPFGDGGTVHGHERLVFAQAGGVDALGEQLLARAGFPADEQVGVRGGVEYAKLFEMPYVRGAGTDVPKRVARGKTF